MAIKTNNWIELTTDQLFYKEGEKFEVIIEPMVLNKGYFQVYRSISHGVAPFFKSGTMEELSMHFRFLESEEIEAINQPVKPS